MKLEIYTFLYKIDKYYIIGLVSSKNKIHVWFLVHLLWKTTGFQPVVYSDN